MPDDPRYHALREHIEGLLTEGRLSRAQAAEAEKVQTYWHVGDALFSHFRGQPDPGYGQRTVANLSQDLKLSTSALYDILRFRRLLPTFPTCGNLAWSHFRILVHLPDAEQVDYYRALADEGRWTVRQLRQAIDADHGGQLLAATDTPARPLRARFGELSTYRVVADPLGRPCPAIDFGFDKLWVPRDLPGFDPARPGDCVTLHDDDDGPRAVVRSDRPRLWTYAACVRKVVDGDTLRVTVDLGLGLRTVARLRLRGIDTAELYTEAGRTARGFVLRALAEAPVLVVTTRLTDIYGRFLADVKFLPGVADPHEVLRRGTYLNRQLLDLELAVRYLD